jgi:hypothetical protein
MIPIDTWISINEPISAFNKQENNPRRKGTAFSFKRLFNPSGSMLIIPVAASNSLLSCFRKVFAKLWLNYTQGNKILPTILADSSHKFGCFYQQLQFGRREIFLQYLRKHMKFFFGAYFHRKHAILSFSFLKKE